jgi:type II secretory pathway pseudopilin PulG
MKKNREQGTERRESKPARSGERGFTLLGLIVAIALVLLALSVAAPRLARSLRRDREVEAVHRGNQYVRAIQLYYRKLGHYPGSIEQLEKTNNIRFLRQRYADPITGNADWRAIPVGQNKTTMKGFFGQPLAGIASAGLGSAAGMASPGIGASAGGAFGAAGALGAPGASGATGSTGASGATGVTDPLGGFGASGATGQSAGISGTGGAFMGVGLDAPGNSIVELNEQTTFATWEFLYDPRVDQLKAKAAALNGGLGSAAAGSLGQTPGAFGSTGSTGSTGPSGATGGAPPPQP